MTPGMGRVIERLESHGLTLPEAPSPVGDYVPAVRTSDLVFTSGQLPLVAGELLAVGVVGHDVTLEEAVRCAQVAALNALAAASTVCDLDQVVRVVKVVGYVSSDQAFFSQPAVINGASGVMIAAFGDAGIHAREAVGVRALPMGAPVEVSVVLETR